jgi:hypothetical protein
MPAADTWTHAISGTITALVLAALVKFSRGEPTQFADLTVLRLPKAMQVMVWVCILFFSALLVGMIVLAALDPDDAKMQRTAMVGVPMCVAFILPIMAELRVQLGFDDHGIGGQTAYRGKRRLAWSSVTKVTWSNAGYWFRLCDRNGEVLRVSAWLQGHHHFVERMCAHVPVEVWQRAVEQWQQRMGHA